MKPMGILLGAVAGIISAAVWAFISYGTGYELGILAWGIGALVGFAVLLGAGNDSNPAMGGVAVVIAILAIVAGKYLAVYMHVDKEFGGLDVAVQFEDEDFLVSYIADEVVTEYEEAGKELNWPEDADMESMSAASDYPADVWAEASNRWGAMSVAERDSFKQERISQTQAKIEAFSGDLTWEAFRASFGLFDVLWFILGAATAFRLGSGATEPQA